MATRGAPRQSDDPAIRSHYLKVAALHILCDRPIKELAAQFRKSRRTICYWISKALSWDDPRSEVLRARRGGFSLDDDQGDDDQGDDAERPER
jgi:hypothetical protein